MTDIDIEGLNDEVAAPEEYVTMDEKRLSHVISDEQLMKLAAGGKDRSFEVFLASTSISLGLLQNFIVTACDIFDKRTPDQINSVLAGFFIVAATTAVISGFSAKFTKEDIDEIVDKIRNRKKSKVPPARTS